MPDADGVHGGGWHRCASAASPSAGSAVRAIRGRLQPVPHRVFIPFYLLFLLYFLLAFFLYATLFAGLASLVKRQEEVQSAIILPLLLLSCGYLLFFFTVATPDATLTKVLSYIPFWTPIFMLMRLAVGTVAWWEIVITVALMLVTILACTWFAARLYRYGVLMYGQRPSLGQMVKLVRMN